MRVPTLHQLRFIKSTKKRINVRAGRRGGKTVGVAQRCVDRFVRLRRRQLYAVPTAEQLTRWWFEVCRALADPIAKGYLKKDETKHTIELPGTELRIRGKTAWNADTLRGDYADDLYLDEFQLMNETALTEVGLPMLMDNDGDLVIIYTPPSARTKGGKADDARYASKLFKAMSLGYESVEAWEDAGATEDRSSEPSDDVMTMHWTTYDNPNVSRKGIESAKRSMTRLAFAQEILAEEQEEIPGAMWSQQLINKNRRPAPPRDTWIRVVTAIDPAGTSNKKSDETGIVTSVLAPCDCFGVENIEDHVFVLRDSSGRYKPAEWGETAINDYEEFDGDRIVGETNNGGEMVENTLRTIDKKHGKRVPRRGANVPYMSIRASRGKLVRAEPVAALDEQGKIHHVEVFKEMEDQMCSFTGEPSNHDDRVDARVYSVTELMPDIGGAELFFGWAGGRR